MKGVTAVAISRPLTSWQRAWPALATFVLVILAIGCLYIARGLLIPTAVAVLLTFVLSPVVTFLQRRGLSRAPAVLVVVLLAAVVAAGVATLVVSQLVHLLGELPTYQHNVAEKIESLRAQSNGSSLIGNVQEFLRTINNAATHPLEPQPPTGEEPVAVEVVERAPQWSLSPWLGGVPPLMEVLAGTGLIIVLVIYSLIFREDLRSRLLSLVGKGHLTLTTKALDDAARRISRYLFAQFILNATFGLSIGIGLSIIGVPHALLWGFCAGVLRYIPFVGPWLAAVFPVSMSLLVSDGWLQPVLVVSLFVVLELSNNLVIEPWVFGQSIGVSQAAILVAVAFWAWLWGPVGLMLAAPLTVCLVVLGKYVPSLKFFDVLLGDEPVLTADINLYQRLLARDEDEAAEIIRRESETLSPVELCDQLLIPTLVHARHDAELDQLTEAEFDYVHAALRELLPEHAEMPADQEAAAADKPARPPLHILGCAARDAADATALKMLEPQLDSRAFRLEQLPGEMLVSEVLEEVDRRQPAAICIVSLAHGGLSHTRHLCKRLRQRFAKLKIVVGRWGAAQTPELRDQLANAGADYVAVTLEQTCEQLHELSQFLRPAGRPTPAGTTLRADGAHLVENTSLESVTGT
jgi:predicted PurR-regulated permease PerM